MLFGRPTSEINSPTRFPVILGLVLALLLSFIFLFPTLSNDWVNWDDEVYVLNNEMVHRMDVKAMFTTGEQVGLYHPLTMLSLAIDDHFWGRDAFGFHLTNLLLHLLNVGLVFFLILRLGRRVEVAFLVALLFGVHPMHLESVAWVSTRKDMLYGAFYLATLLLYLRFRASENGKRWLFYGLALLAFVAALLSKAMAFTLPVVLFLLDYWEGRRFKLRLLLEKAPYFLLAGIAIVVAKWGQQNSDSMEAVSSYPLHKTVFIGTYNTVLYVMKAVVPFKLSAFHPFPFQGEVHLPWWYYGSVLPFLAGVFVWIKSFKKWPLVFFCLSFFMLTIGPVLQILPFGKAVTSERYTYLPYIGLFFLMAMGMYAAVEKWKSLRWPMTVGIGIWLLVLGSITFRQAGIWKNGETLWTDVIRQYPTHYWAYLARGRFYNKAGNPVAAQADLLLAIRFNAELPEGHYELGLSLEELGDFPGAVAAYSRAIEIEPDYHLPYGNRGRIKIAEYGDQARALADFDAAIRVRPDYALAYLNRGLVQRISGNVPAALRDYGEAIRLEPRNAVFRRYRGALLLAERDFVASLRDFDAARDLEPENPENHFLRARALLGKGDRSRALAAAQQVEALGGQLPEGFLVAIQQDSLPVELP